MQYVVSYLCCGSRLRVQAALQAAGLQHALLPRPDLQFTCMDSNGPSIWPSTVKSTKISSAGLQNFMYKGNAMSYQAVVVEASIKLPPAGPGMWPAFWMMPQNSAYGTWPASGGALSEV